MCLVVLQHIAAGRAEGIRHFGIQHFSISAFRHFGIRIEAG
jgi:hypothetical protein